MSTNIKDVIAELDRISALVSRFCDIGDEIDEQKAFGVAYAKAILEYLGIAWVENKSELYKIQVGAYANKDNADKCLAAIKAAGFADAYIRR